MTVSAQHLLLQLVFIPLLLFLPSVRVLLILLFHLGNEPLHVEALLTMVLVNQLADPLFLVETHLPR